MSGIYAGDIRELSSEFAFGSISAQQYHKITSLTKANLKVNSDVQRALDHIKGSAAYTFKSGLCELITAFE